MLVELNQTNQSIIILIIIKMKMHSNNLEEVIFIQSHQAMQKNIIKI